MNLGVLETVGGNRAAARSRFEESICSFETVGERWMRALAQDHEQALALLEPCVGLLSEQRLPLETARCLIELAAAAAGRGDRRRAARALAAAEKVLESEG